MLDVLCKVYSSPNLSDLLDAYPGVRVFLEERYSEEDAVPLSAEDALDYLVDAAIDRFGYPARDVFGAIFKYEETIRRHEMAFYLSLKELQDAVVALNSNRSTSDSISRWVLALTPVYRGPLVSVRWDVDFKSDWVARNVIQNLGESEDMEIRRQIKVLKRIPETRGFAGRLLEPFAHRYITNTTGGFWPLTNMKSNDSDSPHFTLDRNSPVLDDVKFVKVMRKIIKLQSIAKLSACLQNNAYYIPGDPNFPLFDAFTFELDHAKK